MSSSVDGVPDTVICVSDTVLDVAVCLAACCSIDVAADVVIACVLDVSGVTTFVVEVAVYTLEVSCVITAIDIVVGIDVVASRDVVVICMLDVCDEIALVAVVVV